MGLGESSKAIQDIKVHMEMLCTDEMRAHACASAAEHDLQFQIFRILGGYEELLQERKTMLTEEQALKLLKHFWPMGDDESRLKAVQKAREEI
jgi:hypothetical protein